MATETKGLPTEQYHHMIVDTWIDNNEIKSVLVSDNSKKFEPSQSLLCGTLTNT
jgi:hypothetical protein